VEGAPGFRRRRGGTRVLLQDPSHPETVYAGTTEGPDTGRIDAGKYWVRRRART